MTFKHIFPALSIAAILVGCGAGPQPIAEVDIQRNTDANVRVRAIFDAAAGEFDKVPEADKKFLIDRFKDEAGAKLAFEQIKNPPGGMGGAPIPAKDPGAPKPASGPN